MIERVLSVFSKFKERPLIIDILASSKAQGIEEIKSIASDITKKTSHTVEIALDTQNVADFMIEADLAFGGGGTMSWERSCLGLPTILIEVSDDQALVSKNLHELGAVMRIGDMDSITVAEIDKAFETVRDNKVLLGKMSEKAFSICDGKGTENLCRILQTTIENQAA